MRHRAHRSILDRLRPLARTRGALATAALLLVGLATGTALTAGEPAGDAPAAGQAQPSDPGAPYDPATPTITGSTGPDRSPKPTDETTPSASSSLRPTQSPVSRSGGRGTDEPTPLETPSPDTPSVAPTEAPTSQEPAADAPETTATTRSANASRWVIGVGSDAEATFECSLDGGAYQPCDSTVTYEDLGRGRHTFAARATDDAGNTDPSPATLSAEIGPRGQG